ncbi:MAG: spermidine synthase [Omnitrophica WOR_2 bacterium GWF2_38_59]|nr:MAG: spermidine synthase [Omnitrophica WOR_2 bacterium GWF2_38_59]OGX49602.1 MAG: spermidine synthase [Omnitrophica WOR_2 bacterium RIFOXYA2_FULL_38_17]OGX52648.1 MAG: spermidine synthase [Omnitrophica WOR_2 bacterium RIFOXYA12_FULL_38_10]OGX58884.1 MAG: spermidine synthase [Omnitrophica WOR_2 bacterium RIFOXYB2_FULL_38_16]HBG61640.1 spermidine synthase [Candidatus Omnitrophota bacterium]
MRNMWIYESLYPDIKIGLTGQLLYKTKTPFQDVRIYDTDRFGKLLLIDGAIQTTEKDEFIYHEMITHPVLLMHSNPKNILIIGGGDGGVLREVLKHNIKKVTLVEIDEEVINLSKKFFPTLSRGAFNDQRVNIVIQDGARFIRKTKETFDIVIIDSPDPVGAAKALFSKNFYIGISSALKENGIMIRQTGSTIVQDGVLKKNYKLLKAIFPYLAVEIAAIPTYIGGFFSFTIASKSINPHKVQYKTVLKMFENLDLKTKFYNPEIHFASMQLPNYVIEDLQ